MLALLLLRCTAHGGPSKAEAVLANMAKDVVIPLEAEQTIFVITWQASVLFCIFGVAPERGS